MLDRSLHSMISFLQRRHSVPVWTACALAFAILTSLPAVADVTVAKSFLTAVNGNPIGQVNQGDVVVLQINVLNDSAPVSAGTLTDSLPAGMVVAANPQPQFSSGCGAASASPLPGDTSFTFSNATVPAASNGVSGLCVAYVNVQVIGPTAVGQGTVTTLNNTIGAAAFSGIQNGSPVTNLQPVTQSISVTKLANLGVSKSFLPTTVVMGEPTTVKIIISNPNGASSVGLSSLIDNLPGNLSATSPNATWVCPAGNPNTPTAVTGSGTTGAVTFGLNVAGGSVIAAGGSCTLTWPNIIPAPVNGSGGTATNSVPANSVVNDRQLQSAAASAALTVQAPLSVSKSFSPTTVPASTPFNLTLTFNNLSGSTLQSIALTDNLPTSPGAMTAVGAPTTSGSCTNFSAAVVGAVTVNVTATSLASGQSCTVTVPVSASTNGAYTNTTQAPAYTSTNALFGSGTYTLPAVSAAVTVYTEITASKSARDPRNTANAAGSVAPDNPLAYRLTLRNYSTSAVSGVSVSDTLPQSSPGQVSFAANPAPTFVGCTGTTASADGDPSAQFTGISIAAAVGTSPTVCTIVFYTNVSANWPVGTAIVNTIGAVNIGAVDELQGSTPTATSATVARLTATKTNTPTPIYQGQTSLVTLTLTNNNYQDLSSVAVTDTPVYNASNQVVLADQPNASTTCTGTPTYVAAPASTSFQVTGLTVPQRGSCNVSFYVKGIVPGTYTNTATVTGTAADGSTVNATSNAATLNVLSALNATKSFSPAAIAVTGGSTRVTIQLQNVSSSQLTGVALSDPLPTGLIVGATPQASTTCAGPVALTAIAGAASAALSGATIPATGSCLFQFNVATNGQGGASIVNSIPAGGITADGGISNTTATTGTLTTLAAPSVTVQKAFSPASLTMIGQQSLLTITVSNAQSGPIALSNLALSGSLPTGIVVVSNPQTATTCPAGVVTTPNGTAVALSGATLAAGATCTFSAYTTLKGQGSATNTIPAGAVHDDQDITNTTGFSSNLSALPSLGVTEEFQPLHRGTRGRIDTDYPDPQFRDGLSLQRQCS